MKKRNEIKKTCRISLKKFLLGRHQSSIERADVSNSQTTTTTTKKSLYPSHHVIVCLQHYHLFEIEILPDAIICQIFPVTLKFFTNKIIYHSFIYLSTEILSFMKFTNFCLF